MTDLLDALALELRATAPPAPAALRARVDAIAARTPPQPASWRTWIRPRRAFLVLAPAAVTAMLAVAVVHGVSSSPTRSNVSQTVRGAYAGRGVNGPAERAPAYGVVGAPIPSALPSRTATTPFSANADKAAKT